MCDCKNMVVIIETAEDTAIIRLRTYDGYTLDISPNDATRISLALNAAVDLMMSVISE